MRQEPEKLCRFFQKWWQFLEEAYVKIFPVSTSFKSQAKTFYSQNKAVRNKKFPEHVGEYLRELEKN